MESNRTMVRCATRCSLSAVLENAGLGALLLAVFACAAAPSAEPRDAGPNVDAGVGTHASDDPYLELDPRPFGMHTAVATGLDDPYAPAKEAGVAWTRGGAGPYVVWQFVDPELTGDPTRMRWSGSARHPDTGEEVPWQLDGPIQSAAAAGLEVVWNIGIAPTVEKAATKTGTWEPIDEVAYASFVRAAVIRYPDVKVWQVWNEPDLSQTNALTGLAKLHRITYDAIREANPKAVVALAGSAGSFEYYDTVLADLEGCCVDVFDFHYFSDPNGEPHGGYAFIEELAREWRERLDARGFSKTRIWSTENGSFSGHVRTGLSGEPIDETAAEIDQARDLPKRWVVALASGVEKLFWAWGIMEGFGVWDDDAFDHTGLIYDGHGAPRGTKKLAYWALWQMTRMLDDCDFTQRFVALDLGPANTRAYRCTTYSGDPIVVAWWDTFRAEDYVDGKTLEVSLPWTAPTAERHAAVPNASAGSEVTDPTTAFSSETLAPEGGHVAVVLGADPIYVRTTR